MKYTIEYEEEEDGRWIAEIPEIPGVLTYGATQELAGRAAIALFLRVLADRTEQGEGDVWSGADSEIDLHLVPA